MYVVQQCMRLRHFCAPDHSAQPMRLIIFPNFGVYASAAARRFAYHASLCTVRGMGQREMQGHSTMQMLLKCLRNADPKERDGPVNTSFKGNIWIVV